MNKLISTVAAMAVLASSAFAFETNSTGGITNFSGTPATFKTSVKAETPLYPSWYKGDALIYQAFNQADEWESEFTLRNNKPYGIVAKVSIYEGKGSKEILDINVYLSANDVFRFKIADGKFYTEDDSVVTGASQEDESIIEWASKSNPINVKMDTDYGYVIAYGMGQSSITNHGPKAKEKLFKTYRKALSTARPNWRVARMEQGVFVGTKDPVTVAPYVKDDKLPLKDVENKSLSGQVRIYNKSEEPRDLLLNARAIKNFTEKGRVMLWAPRELSNLHDRDIVTPDGNLSIYDKAKVSEDASAFAKSTAYYTFNNNGETPDVDNKLIVTQIYKRTLIQLGNTDGYWVKRKCYNSDTKGYSFQAAGVYWNEREVKHVSQNPGDIEISPGNDTETVGYCNELTEINRPEIGTDVESENGYVNFYFGSKGIPALVTQMSASKVGDQYRINWVKSVVEK
jgi:hypothetical protein